MPNSHEVYIALSMLCATYLFRFSAWPARVEIASWALWHLARELPTENFQRVAARLEIVPVGNPESDLPGMGMRLSGEAGTPSSDELTPGALIKTRADGELWKRYLREAREWLFDLRPNQYFKDGGAAVAGGDR